MEHLCYTYKSTQRLFSNNCDQLIKAEVLLLKGNSLHDRAHACTLLAKCHIHSYIIYTHIMFSHSYMQSYTFVTQCYAIRLDIYIYYKTLD